MLAEIIKRKKLKVSKSRPSDSLLQLMREGRAPSTRFSTALKEQGVSVIAEIKRKSPARGVLSEIADPVQLAKKYEAGGAAAISVLTDPDAFNGDLADLISVSHGVSVPTLRKDFIFDPLQIAEAAMCGASAVLLIASVLESELKVFLEAVYHMGLEALCEVHTERELEMVLNAGATIIGVNNRNLKTFEVDLEVSRRLLRLLPAEVVKVTASGIHNKEDALQMDGYDALLIGEALVSSSHPERLIQEIRKC